jgi:ABC-type nitrate/sulfonate/bicarbonate transport system ATPase subunit
MSESSSSESNKRIPTVAEALANEALDSAALSSKAPIVEFIDVSKRFVDKRSRREFEVLKSFEFKIERKDAGAFVVLLGPSGCGKSTILTLISGLALPDSGQVLINGKLVTGPAPDSACVPQAYTCYPWLTVLKNVEFGLTLQGRTKKDRKAIAMEYLKKVGLEDRWDAYPKQLSGGMQQRVAIARTLAIKPQIVLMDEPFGALDAQTRSEMQQMVLELWDAEQNTIIFVTHDIAEALLLGDRVIVFPTRPIHGCDFYEKKDLDAELGHHRPPDIVRSPEFARLSDDLRERLKKPVRLTPASAS